MKPNELVVESMKHCFQCLDPIQSHIPVESEHESAGWQTLLPHSLWSFSSYLKMDMGKVLNDNDSIPQHLLEKVRKSELKGELCDNCSKMNNKFSQLYWKMVKIEMELVSSLQYFQSKFLKANKAGKSTKLRDLANSMVGLNGGWAGKLDILEVLRAEAIRKCSQKLNDKGTPRVKIENLTMEQVNIKTQKFKRISTMDTDTEGQNSNFEAESDPARDFRNDEMDYSDQELEDIDDYSEFQEKHISHDTEGLAIPGEKANNCSTSADGRLNNQANVGSKETSRDDLHSVTYSFEVVLPTESQKVEKPQPSVDPNSRKHKCNLCPKEFSNQTNFKTHYDSAHLKVKYKCTICGSQFKHLCQYKLHHRSIHMGVRFKSPKIFTSKIRAFLLNKQNVEYTTVVNVDEHNLILKCIDFVVNNTF